MRPIDPRLPKKTVRRARGSGDITEHLRKALWDRITSQAACSDRPEPFQPGEVYEVGDCVGFAGELAEVVEIRDGGNPRQGPFKTLVLEMQDGTRCRVAGSADGRSHHPLAFAVPDWLVEEAVVAYHEATQTPFPAEGFASFAPPSRAETSGAVRSRRTPVEPAPVYSPQIQPLALLSDAELADLWSEHPEWEARALDALEAVRAVLDRFADRRGSLRRNRLEERLVGPILEALGWHVERLDGARSGLGVRFALFADPASQDAFRRPWIEPQVGLSRADLLLSTRGSDLGPDQTGLADADLQLVSALSRNDVRWGGVTDGFEWRFYSCRWENPDVGSAFTEFYECDLGAVVGRNPAGRLPEGKPWWAFVRWWLLWRRESYERNGQGEALIEGLQARAAARARRYARWLRQRMLEVVLPEIAGGFVAYRHRERSVERESQDDLRQIAHASLVLAYKLLFVAYAETRGLLPMGTPSYRAASLTTMIHWAANAVERDVPLSGSTSTTPKYRALLALFRRLDHGAPELELLRTEGGLFGATDPNHAFLERHKLSDRVIARALSALTLDGNWVEAMESLSIRHLCAIGEGLLANGLWIVDAAPGHVAWVEDRKSGRASPSDPVADYVAISTVEDVLTPLLSARASDYRDAMDRLARVRRRAKARGADAEAPAVRAAVARAEDAALQALLGIKILDPAMGAGHFLIVAADVITDWVVAQHRSYRLAHPDLPESWDPLINDLVGARHRIRHRLSSRGLRLRPGWPDDLALVARRVAQRCIYGVDRDPLAVSLARANLSLWAFARGGPLPQLGDHLYRGDSLLGGRIDDLDLPVWNTVDLYGALSSLPWAAPRRDAQRERAGLLRDLLDLWISRYLGNTEAERLLEDRETRESLLDRSSNAGSARWDRAMERARALSAQHRVVHWDLVFPEVFFDPRRRGPDKRSGFDVVLGSPPTFVADEHRAPEITTLPDWPAALTEAEGASLFERLAHRLIRVPIGRVALVMRPKGVAEAGR